MESTFPSEAAPQSGPALSKGATSSWFERLIDWITPARAVPIALAGVALVGLGDVLTGVEVTFALLYKFPIAFGTWFVGRRFGYILSIVSTAGAVVTSLYDETKVSSLTVVWNLTGACTTFLLVVWLVDSLRAHVEREAREKAMAIDQLRHAERLNLIGKLAAGVAHELGTPLNVITANAELMSERRPTDEATRRFTTAILTQAERMTDILRHLLEFGRRGASEIALVDLNRVVARSSELLTALVRRKGSSIELALGEGPLPVRVNAPEIEQVLSNLLMNAAQAMEGAPGPIRVETGVVGGAPDLAFVRVVDTGPGIAPSDLPRLFDPFFTTKGVGEGTGLGLSVSYGIVADHRGRIEVDSTVGRGSRFTVLLRLAE